MHRPLRLDEAVDLTRTGDVWLFRGRSVADRAIRTATNAPVNHVGMALTLDDLPPLLWHAELGRSLQDLWSGEYRRGVQLHDLRDAVTVWRTRYGQQAWLRQLVVPATADDPSGARRARSMEDAVLRTVARLAGTPFPSTMRLAGRWVTGRGARLRLPLRLPVRLPWPGRAGGGAGVGTGVETAYCAEVVAATYQAMGLLPADRAVNWYDPGRFWSGDDLDLLAGARLGDEVPVEVPPARP